MYRYEYRYLLQTQGHHNKYRDEEQYTYSVVPIDKLYTQIIRWAKYFVFLTIEPFAVLFWALGIVLSHILQQLTQPAGQAYLNHAWYWHGTVRQGSVRFNLRERCLGPLPLPILLYYLSIVVLVPIGNRGEEGDRSRDYRGLKYRGCRTEMWSGEG